ncbi:MULTISPECIES: N-acetylglucosamine-6-phosphate deacetylase [unclassified Colwellia]|uniref:N-acetylglucosamine-6-phosphate deacetylase n=1 Tax=unclassified Colwellia TaxID=196834 RepID=UPI0015F3E3EC|nr:MULTISPECIES: N-acetylglucosamine-6-phosphate deacetylase [unclassified Colwellia]MBA6230606.1 N-acetylglucosamine-6-phosphate deacetylase [Colwellia sp. MB02u-7]MBA6234537.1 N-acetylglucosamine-6-phosphate deacetylase [Colwellia sp. MB02u-11]MBA6255401.1 N-acetylglucosamine-6-phosphate deacetylase [Colwellia sp. MB3u-28]MBA6261541.1 N-acetylglucosamine-6-phosphate deacetylase [Colwellia sp. MB3u-41]MBA6301091.1 N-acetylglucosamine-6-phosphate deacetylase [Colwellia sp. MB3u-22]
MTIFRLYVKKLFDGQNYIDDQVLTIADGKIIAFDNNTASVDEVLEGLVVPGFIDLQVNGGGGALFNDSPSLNNIKTIMAAHAKFGTTAMLPTLITDKISVMEQAADAIAKAIAEKVPGIIGIHFEGPHLSVAKKGAHIEEHIRPISLQEWQVLERKDMGRILVTLAPETVSTDDITRMVSLGIKVCLGHSNADFNTAQKALVAGADGFTHLYNAMSPIQGREPGVTGCALLNDQASCGLIVDGHHVNYDSCKLALKAKPAGTIFLVTDAMPPVGTNSIEFDLVGKTVLLNKGKLTSTTGELAGSVLDMAQAVENTHLGLKLPLDEALRMASSYPANYINQRDIRGGLVIGSQADFVELDDKFKVKSTWIAGNRVYKKAC